MQPRKHIGVYSKISETQEGINSRITEAEERISDLEDRMVEFTTVERNKENKIDINNIRLKEI